MSERPILMSGSMVRAILAGQKSMTRRVITPARSLVDGSPWGAAAWARLDLDASTVRVDPGPSPAGNAGPYLKVPLRDGDTEHRVYPRYAPGDLLWVRETWQAWADGATRYRATDCDSGDVPWRPSIFMPRTRSRIALRVTGVRVERVQSITEADAIAEGVATAWGDLGPVACARFQNESCRIARELNPAARTAGPPALFGALWSRINGRASWDADVWVWVVGFERVEVRP